MTPALLAHFRKMQDMGARYLEPGPYVDRDGREWFGQQGFVRDILHMLDGPEARAALAEDEDPIMPETRALHVQPDADGWIKWDGGECPVGPDVMVYVQCRDGYIDKDTARNYSQAGWWQHMPMPWDKDGYGYHHSDIIAYRIIGDAA